MADKCSILQAAQRELKRHSWEHFVDDPPSIAQGGKGVVVLGCPACKKVISTSNGFIEHLANDVLPEIQNPAVNIAKWTPLSLYATSTKTSSRSAWLWLATWCGTFRG